jgi:uncharacterized membrane protein|tara:strand:+ start:2886 stop:3263 length:378 start_codon:yes stop_codon:yes gene_type:complete
MKIILGLKKKLNVCRKLTWTSLAIFGLVLLANSICRSTPLSLTIFTFLPLVILLPGLYEEKYKTISMLCFVTLLYFIVAVDNFFSPSSNYFDVLEIIILVIMFSVAMMYSRWKQYSLYQDDSKST